MRSAREAQGKAPPSKAATTSRMAPFADIPRWVWTIFLTAWASLFGLFLLFFTGTAAARFDVAIAALFAVMAFGLPAALSAQGSPGDHRPGSIIQTRTGPLPVRAAAAQIVLIPVSAVIGLIAFITLAK